MVLAYLVCDLRARSDELHADAGLDEVNDREADEERDGRDDLEVDERLRAHAADLLEVAAARDAYDERREDERRDDGLDHVQEDVAKEKYRVAPVGLDVSEQAAHDEPDHNPGR